MKFLLLVGLIGIVQTSYGVGSTDSKSLNLNEFLEARANDFNLQQSRIADDLFVKGSLSRVFLPVVSDEPFECYLGTPEALPPVKYHVEIIGYRESWTPLFDNHKREIVRSYAL